MCRSCEICKHGKYELCKEMAFAAWVSLRHIGSGRDMEQEFLLIPLT